MEHIIKNYPELATSPLRQTALEIVETGLRAIDTEEALRRAIKINDGLMQVGGRSYNLDDYEHIYIVGFGKVSCTAAYTLERLLAGRVRKGAVIGVKDKVCEVVNTYMGTHPLPSAANYDATKQITEIAQQATEKDLVLVAVSGGGSALLCSSMSECDQGTKLFGSFLQSGGTIEELNLVRKHISSLKGGGLAETLYPATVIGLVFSDVPGGDLGAVASGPTFPDHSTIKDAEALIDKYELGEFDLVETPKDSKYFDKVHNVLVVSNDIALQAMMKEAESRGYQVTLLSNQLYGTTAETGTLLKSNATDQSFLIIGGETKLTIPDDCVGKGGRNDYLALTMLEQLKPGQVFVSLASDGKDNSEAAGALADTDTIKKADGLGIKAEDFTHCLDSYPYFNQVGDHIVTGLLESNVSDLIFLLTAPEA